MNNVFLTYTHKSGTYKIDVKYCPDVESPLSDRDSSEIKIWYKSTSDVAFDLEKYKFTSEIAYLGCLLSDFSDLKVFLRDKLKSYLLANKRQISVFWGNNYAGKWKEYKISLPKDNIVFSKWDYQNDYPKLHIDNFTDYAIESMVDFEFEDLPQSILDWTVEFLQQQNIFMFVLDHDRYHTRLYEESDLNHKLILLIKDYYNTNNNFVLSVLEEYKAWLRGEVYACTLSKKCDCCNQWEIVNSTGGFYALDDDYDNVIKDFLDYCDDEVGIFSDYTKN